MKTLSFLLVGLLLSLATVAQTPLSWSGVRPNPVEKTIVLDPSWSGEASVKVYTAADSRLLSALLQPLVTRTGNTLFVRFNNTSGLTNTTYVRVFTGDVVRYAGPLTLSSTPVIDPPTTPGGGTVFSGIISTSMVQGLTQLLDAKDALINVKLGYVANGIFTQTTDAQIQYDGYTWVKKSGIITPNNGTTKPGPIGFYFERQYKGPIYPEWFGAKAYRAYYVKRIGNVVAGYYEDSAFMIPAVNSGAALRAASDAAEASSKWVQLGNGYYFADSLYINDGNRFEGVTIGDFGSRQPKDGSVLMQLPNVNRDFITFKTTNSLGSRRVTGVILQNFILRGNNSNTIGNGISIRETGTNRNVDSTHANLNGSHTINNIFIREFPENGFYCRAGGVPAIISHVNTLYNGGYGIKWEGIEINRNVTFIDIDGDGNKGGANLYLAAKNAYSHFTVRGLRSETRDNDTYGVTDGFDRAQPYAIEIGDMTENSTVHISDLYANAYNTPNKAADAAILVNTTTETKTPFIQWENVSTLPMPGGGNGSTLYDKRNGVRLDTLRSGVYSRRGYMYGITGINNRFVVGGDGKQTKFVIPDNQITAKGNAPAIGGYESDYKGGFAWRQSAGGVIGTLYDSLGSGNSFLLLSRSALMSPKVSYAEWLIQGSGRMRISGDVAASLDLKDGDAPADGQVIRMKSENGGFSLQRINDSNVSTDTLADMTVGGTWTMKSINPKAAGVYALGSLTGHWANVYGANLIAPSGFSLNMNAAGANSINMSANGTKRFQIFPTTGALVIQNGGTFTDDLFNIGQFGGSVKATQYNVSALNTAPASATATGRLGEVRITAGFIYVCIATNTWVRSALTTW